MGFARSISFAEDLIVAFEDARLFDVKGRLSEFVNDACREKLVAEGFLEAEED